jgi:hypothetical protein
MIHLGYEIKSGEAIGISSSHLIVTGVTQLSGKTTTLEALIHRSKFKAIVFKTKPGEQGFNEGTFSPPYFKEKSDWQYVSSLLEATLKEKLRFERSWIMTACKGTSSLLEVKRNIEQQLSNPKLRDLHRSVYTTLDEYFNLILPQLSVISFSHSLDLQSGVNIMDLTQMKNEIQSLVIRSVLEVVLKEMHDTIVVMPEAWKFLPQERGNPCKQAAEEFIRQGATNRNFLWIDSQDIAGVDKTPLKQVTTWILGLQSELNEVRHTLNQMPISKRLRPKEDEIMTLALGHFFVCTPSFSKKIYVQPSWLDEKTARAVALGKEEVKNLSKPLRATLPPLPKISAPEVDQKLHTLHELEKQIFQIRKDFASKMEEVMIYIKKLAEVVNSFSLAQPKTQNVDLEAIALSIRQKLPNFDLLKQETVDAVLAKLPTHTGMAGPSQSLTVAPLVALQKGFLEEARKRILQMIEALSEEEKKTIKFIEAAQRGVNQKDLCDKCLGIKGNSGGNQAKVRDISKALHALGLVRRDDRVATTYPALKDKIKAELGYHDATDQEIEQVYNHVITELL